MSQSISISPTIQNALEATREALIYENLYDELPALDNVSALLNDGKIKEGYRELQRLSRWERRNKVYVGYTYISSLLYQEIILSN